MSTSAPQIAGVLNCMSLSVVRFSQKLGTCLEHQGKRPGESVLCRTPSVRSVPAPWRGGARLVLRVGHGQREEDVLPREPHLLEAAHHLRFHLRRSRRSGG